MMTQVPSSQVDSVHRPSRPSHTRNVFHFAKVLWSEEECLFLSSPLNFCIATRMTSPVNKLHASQLNLELLGGACVLAVPTYPFRWLLLRSRVCNHLIKLWKSEFFRFWPSLTTHPKLPKQLIYRKVIPSGSERVFFWYVLQYSGSTAFTKCPPAYGEHCRIAPRIPPWYSRFK